MGQRLRRSASIFILPGGMYGQAENHCPGGGQGVHPRLRRQPGVYQPRGEYVDRRITETAFATRMNKESVAVLVSLNMADELMKAQDENARLRRELNALRNK